MIDEQTVWDDVWPVVERLITATLAEDPATISQQLYPGHPAAGALDLFGPGVFDIVLKTILGRERLGLARAIESAEGQVFLEYAWPDPEEGAGAFTAVDVVSVVMTHSDGRWWVSEINPAGIDLPLNAPRAMSVLAGAQLLQEDGAIPPEPWVLPITLYAGVLQLPPRDGSLADAVEALLIPGMQERRYGFLSLLNARRLWRDFVAAAAPDLEPAAPWAAAVEFLISEQIRLGQTQAAIARPYRVTLGAIVNRVKQIKQALAITELDDRYSELQTTQIVYKESSG